jgi:hypothetical protein
MIRQSMLYSTGKGVWKVFYFSLEDLNQSGRSSNAFRILTQILRVFFRIRPASTPPKTSRHMIACFASLIWHSVVSSLAAKTSVPKMSTAVASTSCRLPHCATSTISRYHPSLTSTRSSLPSNLPTRSAARSPKTQRAPWIWVVAST